MPKNIFLIHVKNEETAKKLDPTADFFRIKEREYDELKEYMISTPLTAWDLMDIPDIYKIVNLGSNRL